MSQIRTELSYEADAISWLSEGEKTTSMTSLEWPLREPLEALVCASQRRMVLSHDADAIFWESGEKTTLLILLK